MERYESLFAQLKERKEGAFVPFAYVKLLITR